MDNLALAQEKLAALEKAWILETKADIIFELKHKISDLKQQITELSPDLKVFDDIKEVASVFYVPRVRSEYFTGRKEVLEELYDKLHQNQVVALNQKTPSIALHGLGGMGKTQILIEYANRCKDKGIHQAILWMSADSKETFESGFQTLAIELHLPIEGKPFEEIRISVENWLITNKNKWLLLIDNADELEIIKAFLAKIKGSGQILISTRAQSTRPFAEPIEIEKMTDDEAFEFLNKRTGLAIDQHAKELVIILDNLPLALDQAAAYISETGMGFEDYLDIYQSDSVSLLDERGEIIENDHPDPVAKTWLISFEKIQEKSELAIEILRICAFLSPDGIIEEVFKNIPKKDFNDVLKEILKYSLLKRDTQAKLLFIHHLVQEILRNQLTDDNKKAIINKTVNLLVNAYPDWNNPNFIEWLNSADKWQLNARQAQHWIHKFQQPQYIEIGILFNQVAYFFMLMGNFKQALPLSEKSLNIKKEVLGSRHSNYAISLGNLAGIYEQLGNYEKALLLKKQALEIHKEEGIWHSNYATSLNNLAELYRVMRKLKRALPLFKESLKVRKEVLGTLHPDYAASLNNLAALYYSMGKLKQAQLLYKESLRIRKEISGTQHPDYAFMLNNLALLHDSIGNFKQALPLYEESVEIFKDLLGEQHPNTKAGKRNYETCLAASKKLEKPDRFSKPVRFEFESEGNKISRNDPCPCGSSKKYKHCCGKLV